MNDINTINRNGTTLVAVSGGTVIENTAQMLDTIASANYYYPEHAGLIVRKESLPEEFFDLRSGLAGEMLQKFSNYGVKLAIAGDFSGYQSKALADFIRECNRGSLIFFAGSEDEAAQRLAEKSA